MAERTADLRSEAVSMFASATPAQWKWSPNAATWSMALVVEHLNLSARLGLPEIERALDRLQADGSVSDSLPKYGLLERLFIRMLSPNPPFKVPVPPIYIPKMAADPAAETGPEFLKTLDRTATCIHSANGLDLAKLRIPSPANEKMVFCVGVWLEGLVAHNEYHWMQVRALRDNPGFPKNSTSAERSKT